MTRSLEKVTDRNAIERLLAWKHEYEKIGYKVVNATAISFEIELRDGNVLVELSKDNVIQEVFPS